MRNDPQPRQFSCLIAALISEKWCLEYNAQRDPEHFDADLKGNLQVNEAAKVFGFEAQIRRGRLWRRCGEASSTTDDRLYLSRAKWHVGAPGASGAPVQAFVG